MLRATKYQIQPIHCPRECPPKICEAPGLKRLSEVIYMLKSKLTEYSDAYLFNTQYFEACNPNALEDYKTLSTYLPTLERYHMQLYYGAETCLSIPQAQSVIEQVLDITGHSCDEARMDLITDTTNLDTWKLNNPHCVAYEDWESILYIRCEPLIFDIEVLKELCTKELDCDIDDCNIDFDVLIKTIESCEVRFETIIETFSPENCRLEFGILQEKIPDCTITFDEYVSLRECGIDYKVIIDMNDCDIKISYDVASGCPEITYNSLTIPVCSWSNSSNNGD